MISRIQLSVIGLALALAGCSPRYYIPNTQNVPMIKAKNQVNFSVAGNTNQFELQAAYGITDAVAIQANGAFMGTEDKNTGNGGSGQFYEGGIGLYKNIGDKMLFDTYLLGGFGTLNNTFPSTLKDYPGTSGKISSNVIRAGIQPSLSFISKYFSVSASTRLASLNYAGVSGSLIFENTDQVAYLKDNNSGILVEPALTLRGGFEKVKLQIQLTRSYNLSNPSFKQDFSLLSFGLNLNF